MEQPKIIRGNGKQKQKQKQKQKPSQIQKTKKHEIKGGIKRPREWQAAEKEMEVKKMKEQPKKKFTSLQEKMKAKLEGGQFRYLNEKLYTTDSSSALELFQKQPTLYKVYHKGFSEQTKKWPENPVEVIVQMIKRMPKEWAFADFGCGTALIARSVEQKVHSFDLCKTNEHVTVANSANVPLENESVDAAIFCLSLMGTDFEKFILEARRVLKANGKLIVAEVKSRFIQEDSEVPAEGEEEEGGGKVSQKVKAALMLDGVRKFEKFLSRSGFSLEKRDLKNTMFALQTFQKKALDERDEKKLTQEITSIKESVGFHFKSCKYKRR